MPNYIGIIPARYASTRFPGKPLADIAGHPMFWHVWNQARQCKVLSSVVLATDDSRIADEAQKLNVPYIMTRNDHVCGTDRVFEAAQGLKISDLDVVVNIQGDEPLLDPMLITELTEPFKDDTIMVTTPVSPISAERANNPNQVKVVEDTQHNALYFSRSPIPFPRDKADESKVEYLGHIGLYAFRMLALKKFVSLPQSPLEKLEKLEQLRLLENGIPIRVVLTTHHSAGVDTPEDLERVRAYFAKNK